MVAKVIALLRQSHGLDLSAYEETFLAQALEKYRERTGGASVADCLRRLGEEREEAESFTQALRIGYSEFFRNPLAFALLERQLLPALLAAKEKSGGGEIRVWSAGCATGQEAWSVAILLDELIGSGGHSLSYRIMATDLSETDLAWARAGVYGREAVGNIRARHLDGYFFRQGEFFHIIPRLQERVEFFPYELLDPHTICPPLCIYGDFDLVLCSNVLLYYRPERQRFILAKMRRCLTLDGYLVTDGSERGIVESAGGFRGVVAQPAVFQIRLISNGD